MSVALDRPRAANHFSADIVDAAEIAEAIGVSEATVKTNAAAWTRQHGFPCRLRPFGWHWSRAAIRRWMGVVSNVGDDIETGAEPPRLTIVDEQRADLEARYGGRR